MATRKALKAINWSGIAERLAESDKAVYSSFKSKSDLYLRKVQQYPEKSPPIDWAFYQKNVPVAGMVDNFKKQYEALSIPYPQDKYTQIVEEDAKKAEAHVKDFIDSANKDIAEFQSKIQHIRGLLPFTEMTMEDVWDLYPEERFDPLNNPTVWPHEPEDQLEDPPEEDDH